MKSIERHKFDPEIHLSASFSDCILSVSNYQVIRYILAEIGETFTLEVSIPGPKNRVFGITPP
jgi:hypothetical protein